MHSNLGEKDMHMTKGIRPDWMTRGWGRVDIQFSILIYGQLYMK